MQLATAALAYSAPAATAATIAQTVSGLAGGMGSMAGGDQLAQLQSGGDFYNNYRVHYSNGLRTDRLCLTLCAANLCLGPFCRTGVICC